MDLSKAFDTINHELLIAKLSALKLIHSYLFDHKQHVKVNNTFSEWCELVLGVPQGSVMGPLLFNIYLKYLFFIFKDISVCNFADYTSPYFCDMNLKIVLEKLETYSDFCIQWFENNFMKCNTDKCHLLVSGQKHENCWVRVGSDVIWEDSQVKLLGVTIDNQLKFDKHVNDIFMKTNKKLSALSRMESFLSSDRQRIMFKAFVESQFKYFPLVCFFKAGSPIPKFIKFMSVL